MTIRKNFTLDDSVAKHLEDMAKKRGQKQSQLVSELIEKEAKEEEKQRKLEMIKRLKGMFTGLFPDGVTIQSIKANRDDL